MSENNNNNNNNIPKTLDKPTFFTDTVNATFTSGICGARCKCTDGGGGTGRVLPIPGGAVCNILYSSIESLDNAVIRTSK